MAFACRGCAHTIPGHKLCAPTTKIYQLIFGKPEGHMVSVCCSRRGRSGDGMTTTPSSVDLPLPRWHAAPGHKPRAPTPNDQVWDRNDWSTVLTKRCS